MKVVDNVFVVPGVVANPHLIVDPDGLTVIDTGLPHVSVPCENRRF